jgi:hypothetical protein
VFLVTVVLAGTERREFERLLVAAQPCQPISLQLVTLVLYTTPANPTIRHVSALVLADLTGMLPDQCALCNPTSRVSRVLVPSLNNLSSVRLLQG